MPPDLIHGVVLVLGASRGIGRAVAIAVAEDGRPVVLGCRNAADGEAIAHQLHMRGHRALVVAVDVTNYDAVAAAVAAADEFGRGLAGIVNNAGAVGPLADIEDTDPSAWARTIAVNLIGAYNGTRAALPRLVAGGVVINLSSGAAQLPVEGWSAYCVSKAGLAMLTRTTFTEHGDRLRVYGVQPGMVDTDMQVEIRASGIGALSRVPRRNLSAVGSPARAIVWLLQNAPADLSGMELDLDAVALRLRIGRHLSRGAVHSEFS